MSWAVWVRRGGGGGGVLLGILGGVCRQVLQILTRVSNQKNVIFHIHFQTRPLYPCPFSDLAFRQKLCYDYLERKPKKYSKPFRIRIFLFLSSSFEIETINTFIRSRSSLESHTRFHTKMAKCIPVCRPKRSKTPQWDGTYPCSLYKGVPPGYLRASDLGYLGCLICLRLKGFYLWWASIVPQLFKAGKFQRHLTSWFGF